MRIKCGQMLGSTIAAVRGVEARMRIWTNTSLQFRRRGTVEHSALRILEQIERVGFDRERAALACELRDLFDPREHLLQVRPAAGSRLVDMKQLASQQRRIRLGHVDPTDALVLL